MRLADYLDYTWRNLTRAQLRLVLTVLAVVIGATLVVVMTSVGGGIQRNVLENVRASGGLNESLVSATGPGGGLPGISGQGPSQVQQRELPVAVVGILQPLGTQDDFTIWLNQNDVLDTQEWLTNRRPDLATEGYQALRVKTASTDLV